MSMSCYRTNNPAVIAAKAALDADYASAQEEAIAFMGLFGDGKQLFSNDIASLRFGGCIFNPPKEGPFWTKPDRNFGAQSVRASASRIPATMRDEYKVLRAKWVENFPRRVVKPNAFYASMGTNWGNLLIGGVGYFVGIDGFIYIRTGARLADFMESIPDWMYEKAKLELKGATS